MKLLADTSALLALTLANDAHHAAARAFVRNHPRLRFVVSDLVLSELATRLRARAGASVAVRVVRDYFRSERYSVVFTDAEIFAAALDRMETHSDKRLSLTDCASFELMQRLGMEAAFTFDDDFRKCGFEAKP